jgi:hypothetical protein
MKKRFKTAYFSGKFIPLLHLNNFSQILNGLSGKNKVAEQKLDQFDNTSAGERKSSYHPLVQLLLGLTGLIVPRNPSFWKNRISWWCGNWNDPALAPKRRFDNKVEPWRLLAWPQIDESMTKLNRGGFSPGPK